MPEATLIEVIIYLELCALVGLSYVAGWMISRWYYTYQPRRGKHRYSISRKKGRLQGHSREKDPQAQ